jgi:transposase
MLYPGMEPTNNLGEQAMREHVIIRKIIGCFRSENGAENYQYIASFLATYKLQEKNGFEELAEVLRQELCLS